MAKRGPKAGAEAVAKLEALIAKRTASGEGLPRNGDALHISQICALVGVARSTVHQNPAFRSLLETYATQANLSFSQGGPTASLERKTDSPDNEKETAIMRKRIQFLESRIHELTARNGDLLKRNADLSNRLNTSLLMEHRLSTKGDRRV